MRDFDDLSDTFNRFLVGVRGDYVCVGKALSTSQMTKNEALNLAAWIVLCVDPTKEDFEKLCKLISET